MIISIPRMEGKEGKRLWKPSSEMADWLFSLSNLVLIVSLAVTVVATIGTVWMANVREGYLNRELAEADERIAEASARGEEARSAAAAAEMRAAEANQKAEAERLERLRLGSVPHQSIE